MNPCCEILVESFRDGGIGLRAKQPHDLHPDVRAWLQRTADKILVELATMPRSELLALMVGERCPICGGVFE